MNIVHLVSNKTWGGGERYVLDLCKRATDDGHSAVVITRGYDDVDTPFVKAGFTPGHLPLRGAIDIISPIMLARVLNRMDAPIVLHAHNFKDAHTAVRARRLMKDPSRARVVVTRHLVSLASASVPYADIDDIIFVSQAALDAFLLGKYRGKYDKLHVVHNAIVAPDPAPHKPSDTLRLLYTGRISPEKGVDCLIDAVAALPDVPLHLTVAGRGDATVVQPLMERCRHLGIDSRVDWPGHVDDVYALMADADVGVIPTIVPEAFSLSMLEFMSQGVVPVASDAGGPAEVIRHGEDGLLVPSTDPAALADAIRRLADDRDALRRMSQAARRAYLAEHSYDTFYKRIMDIYERKDTRR